MRSLRKKLFITLVGVACLSIVCLSVAFLNTTPAYAASVHTASNHAQPFASGGGCWTSGDGRVGACVSINGAHVVRSDAYINGPCASYVYIELDDSSGITTATSYSGGCGHFPGNGISAASGHAYRTWVYACFSDYCEWQDSPLQYA